MDSPADRYRPLMHLGEGGTATVQLAVARGPSGFNKLVVLKELHRSMIADAEMRRLFLNEARISARLNHPNIVQVNEIVERDGLPVIVMEYLDGQSLDRILARAERKMPLVLHLYAITRVLRALDYAHHFQDFDGNTLELVHRDISPHNVFVTYAGNVKLLDFGIAVLGESATGDDGLLQGKLQYMAPEQVLSEPPDRRTDLFAIGVMLWELVSERPLWRDVDESTLLHRLANGEIPKPEPVPGVPPELLPIIERALQPEAADRYSSAAAMLADLAPVLHQLGGDASDEALGRYASEMFADRRAETKSAITQHLRDVGLTAVGIDVAELANVTQRRPAKRDRSVVVLFAGAVVLLVVLSLVAVSVLRRGPDARPVTNDAQTDAAVAQRTPQPALVHDAATAAVTTQPVDASVARRTASLSITAFPERAHCSLDGARLANPYFARRDIDHASHTLVCEAAGYTTQTVTFVLNDDYINTVRLEPVAAVATTGVRPRRGSDAGAANSGARTAPNCDPPYTIDERGIRRYRVECLSP